MLYCLVMLYVAISGCVVMLWTHGVWQSSEVVWSCHGVWQCNIVMFCGHVTMLSVDQTQTTSKVFHTYIYPTTHVCTNNNDGYYKSTLTGTSAISSGKGKDIQIAFTSNLPASSILKVIQVVANRNNRINRFLQSTSSDERKVRSTIICPRQHY